jgi:hypothetical protein
LSKGRVGFSRVAGLVVVLLGAALAVRADYRASYETAIKAIDRKDWSGAIRALKAAVEDKSAEGERVLIYGMRYKIYLPHYYLGLAYFNTGNCAEAVKSLDESDRQGAIRQQAEYKDLQRITEQCRGQLPQPAPPTAPAPPTPDRAALTAALNEAEREIGQAERSAAGISKLRGDPALSAIWQGDPSLRDREARAGQDLSAARSALAEAKSRGDQARATSAKETAARAYQAFKALSTLLGERRESAEKMARAREALETQAREREAREKQSKEAEAQAAVRRTFDELGLRLNEARRVLAEADRRQPLPAALARPRGELASAVSEAQKATITMTAADLARLRDRLESQAGVLRKALASTPEAAASLSPSIKPPGVLVEAASAYFQADYSRAAKLLQTIDLSDRRAAAHAFLFRSAAAFATYVLGGEKDRALRDQSEKDARESRRLDPTITPNARAFSPRFADFFRRSSAAGQSAS